MYELATSKGPLQVVTPTHGSLLIRFAGMVIYVDPYATNDLFAKLPKADVIWITHDHYDHLDIPTINRLKKPDTRYVATPIAAAKLPEDTLILANDDGANVADMKLVAVPAYNIKRGPAPGQVFHPKGRGNGYLATFGDQCIYIAGDTEHIPEMQQLPKVHLAVLPVMPPYTMTPLEAAAACNDIQPNTVIPYHCTPANARVFASMFIKHNIKVHLPDFA